MYCLNSIRNIHSGTHSCPFSTLARLANVFQSQSSRKRVVRDSGCLRSFGCRAGSGQTDCTFSGVFIDKGRVWAMYIYLWIKRLSEPSFILKICRNMPMCVKFTGKLGFSWLLSRSPWIRSEQIVTLCIHVKHNLSSSKNHLCSWL